VVRLRPYTLFTNRLGLPLELRQAGGDQLMTLHPWDWRTTFAFSAVQEPLLVQVNEGYILCNKLLFTYKYSADAGCVP